MSRVLKRPMFKLGGSTGAGITSGLSRRGYHGGGSDRPIRTRTTPEKILQGYGPAPRGYNVYDFLTEWGLNMASSPPMGNVIQTAAGTAREPYSKMVEGKGKAGQLEYAMRAQAHDAARTHNLDLKKMDLQEYLEGEKRKSAERIAELNLQSKDVVGKEKTFMGQVDQSLDNAKNARDGILPSDTFKKGYAWYDAITLKNRHTNHILGEVEEIQTAKRGDSTWVLKEFKTPQEWEKYLGVPVFDVTTGAQGAWRIVEVDESSESGYKWSEPYWSKIGTREDGERDQTLYKINNLLKGSLENKQIINQGGDTIEPDIVEKIEMIKEGDRTAVTETLKILNDATFEELEKLASDRGYLLIPPYPVGHGRGHIKKERLYTEQAKEDMGGTFRGKAISEYELIDMIKKEAIHKQFGNGRRKRRKQ